VIERRKLFFADLIKSLVASIQSLLETTPVGSIVDQTPAGNLTNAAAPITEAIGGVTAAAPVTEALGGVTAAALVTETLRGSTGPALRKRQSVPNFADLIKSLVASIQSLLNTTPAGAVIDQASVGDLTNAAAPVTGALGGVTGQALRKRQVHTVGGIISTSKLITVVQPVAESSPIDGILGTTKPVPGLVQSVTGAAPIDMANVVPSTPSVDPPPLYPTPPPWYQGSCQPQTSTWPSNSSLSLPASSANPETALPSAASAGRSASNDAVPIDVSNVLPSTPAVDPTAAVSSVVLAENIAIAQQLLIVLGSLLSKFTDGSALGGLSKRTEYTALAQLRVSLSSSFPECFPEPAHFELTKRQLVGSTFIKNFIGEFHYMYPVLQDTDPQLASGLADIMHNPSLDLPPFESLNMNELPDAMRIFVVHLYIFMSIIEDPFVSNDDKLSIIGALSDGIDIPSKRTMHHGLRKRQTDEGPTLDDAHKVDANTSVGPADSQTANDYSWW
jgi:hypothetical protein